MKIAKADGTYLRELARIECQHVLIIDDFGIQQLDAQGRSALMEIIEDRHGKSSTVITSQVPVSLWHKVIGEYTIADAILDRIVHDAHRIEMQGESLRRKRQVGIEESAELETKRKWSKINHPEQHEVPERNQCKKRVQLAVRKWESIPKSVSV